MATMPDTPADKPTTSAQGSVRGNGSGLDADQPLQAFLRSQGIAAYASLFTDNGIATLAILQTVYADKQARNVFVASLKGDAKQLGRSAVGVIAETWTDATIKAWAQNYERSSAFEANEAERLDASLKSYLQSKGLGGYQHVFQKRKILSLPMLQAVCANKQERDALAADLNGDPSSESAVAKAICDGITTNEIEKTIRAGEKAAPEGPVLDPELTDFLIDKGLAQYGPVFASEGICSLAAMKSLCANAPLKTAVCHKLTEGTVVGDKRFPGSQAASDLLDQIEAADLDDEIERHAYDRKKRRDEARKSRDTNSQEAQRARLDDAKERFDKAIEEVDDLREACATAAKDGRTEVVERAKGRLKEIADALGSERLLKDVKSADFAGIKSMDGILSSIQSRIGAERAKAIREAVDEAPIDLDQLANAHAIFAGFVLTATRAQQATASAMVQMLVTTGVKPSSTTFERHFKGEETFERETHLIETAASAFSTSNQGRAAAFVGSGIAAMSVAGKHASAREARSERVRADQSRQSTEIIARYEWRPQAALRLPSDKFVLSPSLLEALSEIAKQSDPVVQRSWTRDLLNRFGTHLFARVVLGGWYRHVAMGRSSSGASSQKLFETVSKAANWAVSASASYTGLGWGGSAASANEGDKAEAHGSSGLWFYRHDDVEVEVTSAVRGGLEELPIDDWSASVKPSICWQVIDRDDAYPIWEIMRYCPLPATLAPHREKLNALTEWVWINDIFIPSIDTSDDPTLRRVIEAGEYPNIAALTAEFQRRVAIEPPHMKIEVFSCEFESGGPTVAGELTLKPGYKILSGGVELIDAPASGAIVESYPSIEGKSWKWIAKTHVSGNEGRRGHKSRIRVVALHDPLDEWDVAITRHSAGDPAERPTVVAGVAEGYVPVGIGARCVPKQEGTASMCGLASLGFGAEASGAEAGKLKFSAASRGIERATPHTFELHCIALRAPNGAMLDSRVQSIDQFTDAPFRPAQVATAAPGPVLIGGGALCEKPEAALLLASLPMMSNDRAPGGWLTRAGQGGSQGGRTQLITLHNVDHQILRS